MNNMRCVACVVTLLCVALLPTTFSDEVAHHKAGKKVSLERQDFCADLLNSTIHCPAEAFPLVSPVAGENFWKHPDSLKNLMDSARPLGIQKTCEEFKDFYGCLVQMNQGAKKECSADFGPTFDIVADYLVSDTVPFLSTIVKFCDTMYDWLSDNFNCISDSNLIQLLDHCANEDEQAAIECALSEVNKTENCSPDVVHFIKLFDETFLEETEEAVAALASSYDEIETDESEEENDSKEEEEEHKEEVSENEEEEEKEEEDAEEKEENTEEDK